MMQISIREQEVLQLILEEHTTKEIARLLYVSPHTVVSHRKRLLGKLKAKNSVGIVVRALRSGIIELK